MVVAAGLLSGSLLQALDLIISISDTFVIAASLLFGLFCWHMPLSLLQVMCHLENLFWCGGTALGNTIASVWWSSFVDLGRSWTGEDPVTIPVPQPYFNALFIVQSRSSARCYSWQTHGCDVCLGTSAARPCTNAVVDTSGNCWSTTPLVGHRSTPCLQHSRGQAGVRLRDHPTLGRPLPHISVVQQAGRMERERNNEFNRVFLSTFEALALAIDAKDQVTPRAHRRVQRYTMALAEALTFETSRTSMLSEQPLCSMIPASSPYPVHPKQARPPTPSV